MSVSIGDFVNLNMLSNRQNTFFLGGVIFLAGIILFALAELMQTTIDTPRKSQPFDKTEEVKLPLLDLVKKKLNQAGRNITKLSKTAKFKFFLIFVIIIVATSLNIAIHESFIIDAIGLSLITFIIVKIDNNKEKIVFIVFVVVIVFFVSIFYDDVNVFFAKREMKRLDEEFTAIGQLRQDIEKLNRQKQSEE